MKKKESNKRNKVVNVKETKSERRIEKETK